MRAVCRAWERAPSPFRISPPCGWSEMCMRTIWLMHFGDPAEIALNAYPDRVFKSRVNNILPILDPSIRTGKVRIEVTNPGMMKVGMFVTATFEGKTGP